MENYFESLRLNFLDQRESYAKSFPRVFQREFAIGKKNIQPKQKPNNKPFDVVDLKLISMELK